MNFILSPCGTSLLTNEAKNEEKPIVTKNANVKSKTDIPIEEEKETLKNIISRAKNNLEKANANQAKKLSAELNGIITFYEKKEKCTNADVNLLLATDTYLGKETASAIKEWLEKTYKNQKVFILTANKLQTQNYSDFQQGLKELIKDLYENYIKEYKSREYKIIFNLTGGFKSVQGFLQALGMLWNVDEIIYIFEQSSELITIPKLPIEVNEEIFEKEFNFFRRLELGLKIDPNEAKNIPQTLIEEADGLYDFSPWGKALWERVKKTYIREKSWNHQPQKSSLAINFLILAKT